MTEKNLSPQVLKFVKTKMQRTGLPRNHPALKAMLNARTVSELKKAHIKFKAAQTEAQDKIVATTNKKSNEAAAQKKRNAAEAAQKAKTGKAKTNKPKRISKAVSPLIRKAQAEAAAKRERNAAKRERNAAKRERNVAEASRKAAEGKRKAEAKAKAAAQKKRNVAEASRKADKAAKQAKANKQARIRARQELAGGRSGESRRKKPSADAFLTEVLWPLRRARQELAGGRSGESRRKKPSADAFLTEVLWPLRRARQELAGGRSGESRRKKPSADAFLTEVLWPLRRARQELAGGRSGESRTRKPSATGGEKILPFAGRFEGNPLSEKGDEPVDTVIRSPKSKIKPEANVNTKSKKTKVAAKVRPTKPLPHTIEGYDIETGAPVGDDPALVKSPLIRDPVREGYEGPFKISTDTEDYDVGHKHGGKVSKGMRKARSKKRTTKGRKRVALRGHRAELRGG
tara:strand:- start:1950 stop:3326 length:1377 start_codon:yes stop_codon:yes gene_type:complete